ncbi:MAG: class II fructose-bisphosphate aldolase [Thermomicrobiales bacterium]
MTRAGTIELLRRARDGGYAIGAFNVIGLEHAEAIVAAAEAERAPVILQLSENAVAYHLGAVAPIGRACRALADAARVPVALHLDHATTRALCEAALDAGFDSIMFDASALPFDENAQATAEIAALARSRGAGLEAELGVVGGKDASMSSGGLTDPEAAAQYVALTGADALGVAVGSAHKMLARTARLDLGLVTRLRAMVPVPLVLHGASGVPDDALIAAVRSGIAKVNYATQVNQAFTGAIREALLHDPAAVDPRPYLRAARDAATGIVHDRLRVLGSAGRA